MLTTERLVIDPPFRERLAAAKLDSVARVLACRGDHLAAWSRTSDAVRVDLPDARHAIFVKRYHYPRWRNRIKGFFRGVFLGASRARTEYRNLRRMRQAGILAVRPIAYGERRVLHFLCSSFLITEAVPDAVSLATFTKTYGRQPRVGASLRIRHEILRGLAREIRRMHDAGFVHRDLFWRNVLVRPMGPEKFEFCFLDASVGRRIRVPRWRREKIVQDLAALSVLAPDFCSRADQLRFMRHYLGTDTLTPDDRAWLLEVQRHWAKYREAETVRFDRGRVFDAPAARSAAMSGAADSQPATG